MKDGQPLLKISAFLREEAPIVPRPAFVPSLQGSIYAADFVVLQNPVTPHGGAQSNIHKYAIHKK
jgi:hypothetical protein